jgi:5'-phosphate synthase pdxT subunit
MLAVFGTCAGAILLASDILGKNAPEGLGLMDIAIDRNAYGTQIQSFHADVAVRGIGKIPVAFIRAPKIIRVGNNGEILASYEGAPVLVRQGRFLACTCHPEVRGETGIHRMFLKM